MRSGRAPVCRSRWCCPTARAAAPATASRVSRSCSAPRRRCCGAFTRGYLGLLEAYFDGDVDVDGDLRTAFAAGMLSDLGQQVRTVTTVENDLHEWRRSNRSPAQAKANARAHYGLGGRSTGSGSTSR